MVNSVIIIDTNIFHHDIKLVEDIINNSSILNVVIVIPWAVLQELDSQKTIRNSSLARSAQQAHDKILEWFKAYPNWIRGQKTNEYISSFENNDDKILDCCNYFKTYFPAPVVLLTNDKNLRVKGEVHEINTNTSAELNKQFQEAIKNLINNMEVDVPYNKELNEKPLNQVILHDNPVIEDKNDITMYDAPKETFDHLPHVYDANNVEMEDYHPEDGACLENGSEFNYVSHFGPSVHYSIELYSVIASIIQYCEANLNQQLQKHLEKELGDMWDLSVKYQPPWTLNQMVEIIDQKYDSIFKSIYPSELKQTLYKLKSILKSWTRLKEYNLGKVYKNDALNLVQFTELLLMLDKNQRTEVMDRRGLLNHFRESIVKCREP